ncbi:hypothetical protein BH10ACT7_BH10ACT7_18640 [soil metagenome]
MITLGRMSAPTAAVAEFSKLFSGGTFTLVQRFNRQNIKFCSTIEFSKVRAYRERAGAYCTDWHTAGHDKVIEVIDSEWVAELKALAQPATRDAWAMRHFLAYLDGEGAIEVIAEDVRLFPDIVEK